MTKPALHFLDPLEPRTRGEAVLESLALMVDRAGLKVGDKLPPEVALAQQLGVGRSTMREALNRWEGLGVIRRRRGDGTYLAAAIQPPGSAVPVMVQMEGEQILRLLELRRSLESDIARKAALRATPAQRAEILRLCEEVLDTVARGEEYHEIDMAFHTAIADATGNPVFGQTLSRLNEMIIRAPDSPFTLAEFGLTSFPPHRDLAIAVAAGEPEAAANAVQAILSAVDAEIRAMIGAGPPPPG